MTYPKETRELVLEAYRQTRNSVKAAEMTGVSHATVSRIVNEAGEKYERPPLTKEALLDASHPSHGKVTGYYAGCRCEKCVNAMRIHWKKVQVRRVLRGGHPYGKHRG